MNKTTNNLKIKIFIKLMITLNTVKFKQSQSKNK